MRIYADTSFIIELLNKGAKNHTSTRRFFESQANAEWITSDWTQFETSNSLRQLCQQNPAIKPEQAEALIRILKHWHSHGNFRLEPTNANEAITEAMQLSAAYSNKFRMRSADVLHVALLEQVEHDLFVTRDADQYKLAMARAFKAQLLP